MVNTFIHYPARGLCTFQVLFIILCICILFIPLQYSESIGNQVNYDVISRWRRIFYLRIYVHVFAYQSLEVSSTHTHAMRIKTFWASCSTSRFCIIKTTLECERNSTLGRCRNAYTGTKRGRKCNVAAAD